VKKNILTTFPSYDVLIKRMNGVKSPPFREINGHIHTPYSFSAFDKMETALIMAKEEKIAVLGINDFFVTDGYETFYNSCLRNNVFPLFNIEFVGLMKKEQKDGIRINDPNNPGRIYFCGKGLDYPFTLGLLSKLQLQMVIMESQNQMKAMIAKLNDLIKTINPSLSLNHEKIRDRFTEDMVRERHIAKAIRYLATENYKTPEEQLHFIESLYKGKKSKAGMENTAALENEIRSNLLKSGGTAFVEETRKSFLELKKIIKIINEAGGIPCYPVLLDDASGKYTEFESDPVRLHQSLTSLGIGCIELIPGRNDHTALKSFVEFFNEKGFVILFGTEHNTPELTPLTVTARGSQPLDDSLKRIASVPEGARQAGVCPG
jgi:regulator of replication initiation timing